MTVETGGLRALLQPAPLAAAAAIVLPPAMLAHVVQPGGGPATADLAEALWLVKGAILALAFVAWWVAPRLPRGGPSTAPRESLGPLMLLLVVGLALRLPGLDAGLWFDEIQTLVEYVRLPWGALLTTFDSSNQHFAFSLAAKAATDLWGESAWTLRLPAALCGVLSLWATLWFGRLWLPRREAWWGAALLAVSYHHVWFSQNARGYTGLLLTTVVATGLMLEMLRGRPASAGVVWSYAWAMAIAILFHVTAGVVLAGHGLAWAWRVRHLPPGPARWAPMLAMALGAALAVTLLLPVLSDAVRALAASGTGPLPSEWQNPAWFLAESLRGLVRGVPAGVVVVPVALGAVAWGVWAAARRDALATALMTGPLVVMAVLLLATGHNFWPRFFFFGAAFLVQFAVRGGTALLERAVPGRAATLAAAGVVAAVAASLMLLPRAWAPKQDFPATLAWLDARVRPGEQVAITAMLDLPLNHWLGRTLPVVEDAEELATLEVAHPRVWVVYTFPIRLQAVSPGLWARLAGEYELAHVVPGTIGGGDIVIVARPPVDPELEVPR